LPRRQNGELIYYALADNGVSWRALAPLLRAFVGVTVTDFVGRTTPLRADDPLERWLATTGLLIARLKPGSGSDRRTVARALLQRLPDLVARPEGAGRMMPRSTDQVLRSFDLALVAGNRDDAETQIAYLHEHHRLDALNLYFLEAQADAALGAWATLRGRRFFGDLCHTRRPQRITAALVEALFWTAIEPVAQADGLESALEKFRRLIHGQVGTLLDVPPPAPSRPVATMFLLAALTGDSPDRAAIEQLTATALLWPAEEQAEFTTWLSLVPPDAALTLIDRTYAVLLRRNSGGAARSGRGGVWPSRRISSCQRALTAPTVSCGSRRSSCSTTKVRNTSATCRTNT
jgi:hypothetical protein